MGGGGGGHMGGGAGGGGRVTHSFTPAGGGGAHTGGVHTSTGGVHINRTGGAGNRGGIRGGSNNRVVNRTVNNRTVNNSHTTINRTINRTVSANHVNVRNSWRGSHPSATVASHAVWHSGRTWWRGNARFNGYSGPRAGFYFAPGRGYYSVPREYWGHSWGVGAFLPLFFLTYAFADYYDYGLPPPPPGCEWVWVGPNVLLVSIDDGYVVDEYYNVY